MPTDRPLSEAIGEYPQLRGPSAYDVAVAAGFVGSEAAWLASLHGANGADGADGLDGDDAAVTNANVNTAIVADRAATKAALALVKGDVGLGNVSNTSDANKPVSTAQQTALDLKLDDSQAGAFGLTLLGGANLAAAKASLAYVKADVGLGNVDNTSDANKPVSTAQQTALDLKAPLAGPVFTGIPAAPTAALGTNSTQLANTAFVAAAIANLIASAPGALDTLNELAAAIGNDANYAATITGLLAGKQPLDSDLTAIAALTTTGFGRSFLALADAAAARTLIGAVIGTDVQAFDADLAAIAALTTTAYGRALLTTADQAALTALLAVASAALPGAMSAQDKTRLDALHGSYRTLLDSSGSHTAARVAGTYGFGQGDPLAITGVGTLYPLNVLQIDAADYPAVGNLAAKLRVKVNLAVNDVAPTGNYTFGLHPVTRPGTSGGAGLGIFTIGAAVAGSTVAINTPAADSHTSSSGADFALPANGLYILGMVSSATVATSSHLLASAALQLHYA
jgi:hypothetical protein